MLQTIYHIGRNTFRESLRQPIFIILLLSGLGVIGMYPTISVWFSFRAQEKLVIDGSLATILLFGWITAVLCASHTISREIESGTILLILSKPISRPVFVLAKLLGVLTALVLYTWVLSTATLIALRMATDQFRFDPYLAGMLVGLVVFACVYGGIRNYFGAGMSGLTATLITILVTAVLGGGISAVGLAAKSNQALLTPLLMIILLGFIAGVVFFVLRKKAGRSIEGFSFAEETVKCLVVLFTIAIIGVYFLPPWASVRYEWSAGFGGYNWKLVRELVLILFAVLAMGTLATALSTRLDLMSNMVISGVVFTLGLTSNYLYQRMLALKLQEIEKMMHSWFFALIPFLLIVWMLTSKHFHNRRRQQIGRLQIHASFLIMLAAILSKALYNHQLQLHLNAPGAWMRGVAMGLYQIKNIAAHIMYAVIPNWQHFWLADLVTKEGAAPIPFDYIFFCGLYVLLLMVMFTSLALILFQDREVGTQNLA